MGGIYSNERPEMSRIISECAQAERERVMCAPDSDIPTERCIDGRYISITQKNLAYKALDELREFNLRCYGVPNAIVSGLPRKGD